MHGHAATEALAGQRTALNLQGIDVAEVSRGMVLTEPGLFSPASMFDCYLELLPSAPAPIHLRKRIRFHAGTAELMGHVVLLGQDRCIPVNLHLFRSGSKSRRSLYQVIASSSASIHR